ncbi:hypothetical protein ACOJA0_11420, partial [Corynebacterium amycolatum]
YFPPRCGPLQDGPHDPSHPGQIFLAYSRFSHLLKRNKTWDTSAYTELLRPIAAPLIAVTDGGQGAQSAIHHCWPTTRIQRCLVH